MEKSVEIKTEKGPLIKQSRNYESTFKRAIGVAASRR